MIVVNSRNINPAVAERRFFFDSFKKTIKKIHGL